MTGRIDTTRRLARVLAFDIAAAVLLLVFVLTAGWLWLAVLAPVLFVAVVIRLALRALARYLDSPLTEFDLYCASVDRQVDELAARRATRPVGNLIEVDFRRGGAA